MVHVHFDLVLGPFWTPGALKGLVLAPKCPFGGPQGPRRAPVGQIWSQLPPIGRPELDSWSTHTLTWYRAPSGSQGALKGLVLGPKMPFWVLPRSRAYIWNEKNSQKNWAMKIQALGPNSPFRAPWDPEGARYQVKVCVDHESNSGGPMGGRWDQIWLPVVLRGPLGPPKGPFGAKASPFGGRRGPVRGPSA